MVVISGSMGWSYGMRYRRAFIVCGGVRHRTCSSREAEPRRPRTEMAGQKNAYSVRELCVYATALDNSGSLPRPRLCGQRKASHISEPVPSSPSWLSPRKWCIRVLTKQVPFFFVVVFFCVFSSPKVRPCLACAAWYEYAPVAFKYSRRPVVPLFLASATGTDGGKPFVCNYILVGFFFF